MTELPTFEKVPRHKKFDGKWFIISDIAFTPKNAEESMKVCEKVSGICKQMKYRHTSGAIEYAIYARNPRGKYGGPPRYE